MSTLSNIIDKHEAALRSKGVRLSDVLERAGVDRSTWTRWKNGTTAGPRLNVWMKVEEEIAAALNEGEAA